MKITESFGYLGATYKSGPTKGKCNVSNNAPTLSTMDNICGTGSVSC